MSWVDSLPILVQALIGFGAARTDEAFESCRRMTAGGLV